MVTAAFFELAGNFMFHGTECIGSDEVSGHHVDFFLAARWVYLVRNNKILVVCHGREEQIGHCFVKWFPGLLPPPFPDCHT